MSWKSTKKNIENVVMDTILTKNLKYFLRSKPSMIQGVSEIFIGTSNFQKIAIWDN